MPRNKRPKYNQYNLTSSQRRMLRQDPTLYFYSVEASAEPGGAPVWIKRDNPYHGAAAAIADGAAHASTSHGSAAGQQPDVAVSADGHTVLPTAHGPDDHEQHLAVPDAEWSAKDIAQSAAEQDSPGCVYSVHNPELPNAVRLDAAARGSAGLGAYAQLEASLGVLEQRVKDLEEDRRALLDTVSVRETSGVCVLS